MHMRAPISTTPNRGSQLSVAGPAVVSAFAAAVVVWVTWFVTHIPWSGLTAPVQTGFVVGAWLIAAMVAGRRVGNVGGRALKVGLVSGLITSLVGLLILGSKLVQPEVGSATGAALRPSAAVMALGFVGLGMLIGTIGGLVGSLFPRGEHNQRDEPDWLARFAIVVLAIAAPLLFIGGLVTTTNSGMAVPDWPNTFSSNMFLYPLGTAPADIFLEHSHRLFGTFLGLGSLVLMVWTARVEKRRWVKGWAVGIFVAVCLQGLLGGLRVLKGDAASVEDHGWNAVLHGIGAQLIFSALVALAVYLSPLYKSAVANPNAPGGKRLRIFGAAALHSTFLQLVFGAIYRHTRSMHALWTHAGFSIFVVLFSVLSGALSLKAAEGGSPLERALGRVGRWQFAVVAVQFALGWVVFMMGGKALNAETVGAAILRTSHQANGALLVAISTVAVVLARKLCPKRA